MHYRTAILFAVLSPLLSGAATVFQWQVATVLHPLALACFGQLLGGTLLLFICKDFHQVKQQQRLILLVALLRGVIAGVVLMMGLHYTTAVKAIFLTKVEPYFVLLWRGVLQGDRPGRRDLALITLHFMGAILLSTGGDLQGFGAAQLGDLLIVAGMCVSGGAYFHSHKLSSLIGGRAAAAFTSLAAALLLLPPTLLIGLPNSLPDQETSINFLLYVFLFFCLSLPLWFAALKAAPGWIVSALRAVGPFGGMPLAYLLFGQQLKGMEALGGAIVLLTSALLALKGRPQRPAVL